MLALTLRMVISTVFHHKIINIGITRNAVDTELISQQDVIQCEGCLEYGGVNRGARDGTFDAPDCKLSALPKFLDYEILSYCHPFMLILVYLLQYFYGDIILS